MAKLEFYLDRRRSSDGTATIKLRIYHNGESLYNTGVDVDPKFWDPSTMSVVRHRFADMFNERIELVYRAAHEIMVKLDRDNRLASTRSIDIVDLIRQRLESSDAPDSSLFFPGYIETTKTKTGRNREIYETAMKRILEFVTNREYVVDEKSLVGMTFATKFDIRYKAHKDCLNDRRVRMLRYDDIDLKWLNTFDAFLRPQSPSVNARSIIYRCMRHVFKNARLYGYTEAHPFDFFKIKKEETPHRSIITPELRTFWTFQPEDHLQFFHDMFKLTFMLIGINSADLCDLKKITPNGRIEYARHKTHRLYSIKVEPEAKIIIDRWRGSDHLLCCIERYKDNKNFLQYTNRHLKLIGPVTWSISKGRNHLPEKNVNALLPDITLYWARHSWATVASELDIPKEVISAALGHSMGSRVTAVYINFDQEKVDIANRLVLDWVLYHKYTSWYKAMEQYRERKEQERVEASKVCSIVESKAV